MPENYEGISFSTCYLISPYPSLGISLETVLATKEYTDAVRRLMALHDECMRRLNNPSPCEAMDAYEECDWQSQYFDIEKS